MFVHWALKSLFAGDTNAAPVSYLQAFFTSGNSGTKILLRAKNCISQRQQSILSCWCSLWFWSGSAPYPKTMTTFPHCHLCTGWLLCKSSGLTFDWRMWKSACSFCGCSFMILELPKVFWKMKFYLCLRKFEISVVPKKKNIIILFLYLEF